MVETSRLKQMKIGKYYVYEFEKYLVAIDRKVNKIVDILKKRPEIWDNSKFRVCPIGESIKGEVLACGVNFKTAIENSLKQNIAKAHYYLEEKHENWSMQADMLVIIAKEKEDEKKKGIERLQIEIWQALGETTNELFFIHGYFYPSEKVFDHLDGAVIQVDNETISEIFSKKRKIKEGDKQKYFQIDTVIDYETAFNLIENFMPISELVDEFTCNTID